LIEAGLVLAFAPWTDFWLRNYFAVAWPWLGTWMSSPYARGAVTGIGIVTAITGVRELAAAMRARSGSSTEPPASVPSGTGRP
jgi:hypothetical protein